MENNRQTSVNQIVKIIIEGIDKGTFEVGKRLPSQRELSSIFGVSRMVIREAIKVLEGRGIVYSRQGSGIYVKQNAVVAEQMNGDTAPEYTYKEILELSREMWSDAMELIVKNATDAEIHTIENKVESFYTKYSAATTAQQKFMYEAAFGMDMCKATHNALLHKLMMELLDITSDIDFLIIEKNRNYKEFLEIDRKIASALLQRDASRAVFWGRERDRVIDELINGDADMLKNTAHLHIKHQK
ncbi:FadR/GntR family transcriptional regulator [Desulfotignum balticum]|uniref:FadR/GntR family transcriptional regulator n=1 Tax=Desulfotignum balticum TaxID=115781 RepID=UPI00042256AC|nr:GntR family transcriptional regulator [Desulfotignum balticum]